MTPTEVRAARKRLGLTQGQAAGLFGVEHRTWKRWEAEEAASRRAIPPSATLLLRACLTMPRLVQWLAKQAVARSSWGPLRKGSATVLRKKGDKSPLP